MAITDIAQSYLSLEDRALESGIFKIRLVDGKRIPDGVYDLHRGDKTELSKNRTITNVKATFLLTELTRTLSSYYRVSTDHSAETANAISEDTNTILEEISVELSGILLKYGLTKEESDTYVNKIVSNKSFMRLVKRKITNTGAFDEIKANRKYEYLYRPLFQVFQKHFASKKNRGKDRIFYFIAHFLVGCKLEEPGIKEAYARIKKAMNRRSKPEKAMIMA